jgi:hypothetical protein
MLPWKAVYITHGGTEVYLDAGVHKSSKNIGATSKF